MRHNKFLIGVLLGWVYFVGQTAMANFDLWDIQEIYSNEDGTIQFIELSSSSDNQESLSGVSLCRVGKCPFVCLPFMPLSMEFGGQR